MKGTPNAVVAAQFRHLMLLERLGQREARRLLADSMAREMEEARSGLAPLDEWPGIPARSYRVHSRGTNHVRAARMLEYVADGDRVLDIGVNWGYLTGIFLRERRLASYWGIDITREQIDSVGEMARQNGLDGDGLRLDVKDLYDLVPEEVAACDPSLVLVLEVLEHVPDAERAVSTIARALPDDAVLVFSVPILGRLEGCWGHLSVFDSHRIADMCADAGLTVQNVEALHNAWAVVVATRTPEPPPLVTRLQDADLHRLADAPGVLVGHRFEPVAADRITASEQWTRRLAGSEVTAGDDGSTLCRAQALEGDGTGYAGVAFDVPSLTLLRLELSVPDAEAVTALYVDAYRDDGSRCLRWSWRRSQGDELPADETTFVLRPGQASRMLRASQGREGAAARRVHVFAAIDPAGTAEVRVHRAAVVR